MGNSPHRHRPRNWGVPPTRRTRPAGYLSADEGGIHEQSDRHDGTEEDSAGAAALVEEGSAFLQWTADGEPERNETAAERLDVVVIGAGQAGLSVGYFLAKTGLRFAILDANARVGDSWRARWDSLRLFTSARFDVSPGCRFRDPGTPSRRRTRWPTIWRRTRRGLRSRSSTGLRVERLRRDDAVLVERRAAVVRCGPRLVAMATLPEAVGPASRRSSIPGFSSSTRATTGIRGSCGRAPSSSSGQAIPGPRSRSTSRAPRNRLFRSHPDHLAGRDPGHLPFASTGPGPSAFSCRSSSAACFTGF